GKDLGLHDRRPGRRVVRHPLADPAGDGLGGDGVGPETGPALVGYPAEAFLQQEAREGVLFIGAAAPDVAGQLLVVLGRVEPAERQAEAVLAARGPMTGAGIAAADVQARDHVLAEADLLRLIELGYRDGH